MKYENLSDSKIQYIAGSCNINGSTQHTKETKDDIRYIAGNYIMNNIHQKYLLWAIKLRFTEGLVIFTPQPMVSVWTLGRMGCGKSLSGRYFRNREVEEVDTW